MIRIFTRQIERLGTEDGQAMVFVAMVGLLIFLFFAMSMNMAQLINTKIKHQNAADATVYSAAVWEARALNLVAGMNQRMLLAYLAAVTSGGVGIIDSGLIFVVCSSVCPPFTNPACIACLVPLIFIFLASFALFIESVDMLRIMGVRQDQILAIVNYTALEGGAALAGRMGELPNILELNYSFKQNTDDDTVGVYLSSQNDAGQILQGCIPRENKACFLERAGPCELMVSGGYYLNWLWHDSGGTMGISDADWYNVLDDIETLYQVGQPCYDLRLPDIFFINLGVDFQPFPYMLRTRDHNLIPQELETMLSMTVGIHKEREPALVMGKGTGPGDCESNPGVDTKFPCPSAHTYAFSSAHAYSETVSDFYNRALCRNGDPNDCIVTPYPVPLIPFDMDWQPRLFPIDPCSIPGSSPYGEACPVGQTRYDGDDAYLDIAGRVGTDLGADERTFLLNNLLNFGGREFFLY